MPPISAVELTAFDSEKHLPLLDVWLHRPHVRRWWGVPEVALAGARERPPGSGHSIIAADSIPVGYVCWQPYEEEDREILAWSALPRGTIDIDIMIGELSHVGCGVGPRALALLLRQLAENVSVELAGLCVSTHNMSAIRAYEKAGFSRVCEFVDPDWGRCRFMAADLGRSRSKTR
jgi:RimJ/RimL family protein N-acetyltransferase